MCEVRSPRRPDPPPEVLVTCVRVATLSATRLRVHVTGASLASSAARLRGVVARGAARIATLFVLSVR